MSKLRRGGAELVCDRCTLKLTASSAEVAKDLAETHAAQQHPSQACGFQGLQRIALNLPPAIPPPPPPPPQPCDAQAAVHPASYHAKMKMPGNHDCVKTDGRGHSGSHRCRCGFTYSGEDAIENVGVRP